MIFHTEVHGFKSENLEAVAEEVAAATGAELSIHHNDTYGGDYGFFKPKQGGRLKLYDNQNRMDHEWHEEAYKEFGLILKVEQQDARVDFAARLEEMKAHKPTLLYRTEFDDQAWTYEKLFELKPGSLKKDLSKASRPRSLSGHS